MCIVAARSRTSILQMEATVALAESAAETKVEAAATAMAAAETAGSAEEVSVAQLVTAEVELEMAGELAAQLLAGAFISSSTMMGERRQLLSVRVARELDENFQVEFP